MTSSFYILYCFWIRKYMFSYPFFCLAAAFRLCCALAAGSAESCAVVEAAFFLAAAAFLPAAARPNDTVIHHWLSSA